VHCCYNTQEYIPNDLDEHLLKQSVYQQKSRRLLNKTRKKHQLATLIGCIISLLSSAPNPARHAQLLFVLHTWLMREYFGNRHYRWLSTHQWFYHYCHPTCQ